MFLQAFFVFEIHETRIAALQIANNLQVQTEQITNMEVSFVSSSDVITVVTSSRIFKFKVKCICTDV
jgi:hypothetical protein